MKRFITTIFLMLTFLAFAQQVTYVISFTPPEGWTKEEKQNVIVYTGVDNKNKTWCQIGVYRNTTSKGNIETDLQSEWQNLVVNDYGVKEIFQETEAITENG